MKALLKFGAAALIFATAACGGSGDAGNLSTATGDNAPLPQIAAPNNGDWTQVVSATPEGGFRMGNPNAPVKLLEYASATCPHCAEFAEAGGAPLRDQYVRSGQVSWEYRPYMIFPTDPGIFMLLRCRGAEAFFPLMEQLYADREGWTGRLQSMTDEQSQAIGALGGTQKAAALVQLTGIDQFFRQHGMPQARVTSCLADQQNLDQLVEITSTATNEAQVGGTPTFFINGTNQNVDRWSTLEPRLRTAIGG